MDFVLTETGLECPPGFLALSPEEKAAICNGAGPRRFGWLIPDTMYGLSVTPAADIHDYMYHVGWNQEEADALFKKNMHRIIDMHGGKLRGVRRVRANTYFWFVSAFGRFFK